MYKSKSSILVTVIIVAVLIAAVVAVGVFSSGFKNWDVKTWFDFDSSNSNDSILNDNNDITNLENSFIISPNANSNISFKSAVIEPADFKNYGVSSLAESAYTLNATINSSYGYMDYLNWDLSFVDSDSDWAIDKNVNDYVNINISGDYNQIAVVSCLQGFSEQIIITVSLNDNSSINSTCTVDYARDFDIRDSLSLISEWTIPGIGLSQSQTFSNIFNFDDSIKTLSFNSKFVISGSEYSLNFTDISLVKYDNLGTISPSYSFTIDFIISDGFSNSLSSESLVFANVFPTMSGSFITGPFANFIINYDFMYQYFGINYSADNAKWLQFYNAINNNTDEYEFELVLTVSTDYNVHSVSSYIALDASSFDSLLSIDLDNDSIIF